MCVCVWKYWLGKERKPEVINCWQVQITEDEIEINKAQHIVLSLAATTGEQNHAHYTGIIALLSESLKTFWKLVFFKVVLTLLKLRTILTRLKGRKKTATKNSPWSKTWTDKIFTVLSQTKAASLTQLQVLNTDWWEKIYDWLRFIYMWSL